MRVRGTSLLTGLLAAGLLLAGCGTATTASPPAGLSINAAGATAAADYLWMLSAAGGTVTGIGADTGDEVLTLTLTGVNDHATQFADRPARDAYVISTPDFADRWDAWFGSTPPNAVLSYQLAGDVRPRAIVLEIDDPQYDAAAGTITFVARHLHRGSDPHPDAIAPIEVAPRAVPASFRSASLFIDSAGDAEAATDAVASDAASGSPAPESSAASESPSPSASESASAAPSAASSAPSAAPSPELGAESTLVATVLGRVTPMDVSLGDGSFAFDPAGTSTSGAGTLTSGQSTTFETKVTGAPASSTFTYQVYELGAPTGYWVRGKATAYPADSFSRDTSSCDFFDGNPADGAPQVSTEREPYECTMTYLTTDDAGEYVVRYAIAPKVWATVRGSMTPKGVLSLTAGQVSSGNARWDYNSAPVTAALPPAKVPSGRTDSWVAYHRNGDINAHAARVDFAYQIVDGDVVTPYWVVGDSENYRGAEFDHDGTCAIYDGNPFASDAKPVALAPYVCTAEGANVDGRGDWRVDFTVSALPAQRVNATTNAPEAKRLLQAGCAKEGDSCSYIPTSITDTTLDPTKVSNKTGNRTPEPVEAAIEWSYRHAVSNTLGVEVDVKDEFNMVFEKVTASIKVKYSLDVTDTYTTTQTNTLTIPPGCASWWELSPSYKQVTGDFVVAVDGRLYRITNITWTLPEKPASTSGVIAGTLTAMSEPVSGSTRSCSMPTKAG